MDVLTPSLVEEGSPEGVVEPTALSRNRFSVLSLQGICLQSVVGVSAGVYAWKINNVMILEYMLAVGHSWFVIFVWSASLPVDTSRGFWLSCLVVLVCHAAPCQAMKRTSSESSRQAATHTESEWTWRLYQTGTCIMVISSIVAMYRLRLSFRSLYSESDLHVQTVDCLTGVLKVGVLQLSILTVAFVGVQGKSFQELVDSAEQYPENERVFEGLITGLHAHFLGAAASLFLVQRILTKYILRQEMLDFVQGELGTLECLSGILQLLIVISLSIFLTTSNDDVADFLSDRERTSGLATLLSMGYMFPITLLLLFAIYYSWICTSENKQWEFFQKRHERATSSPPVEQRLRQGEAERRNLIELTRVCLQQHTHAQDVQQLQRLMDNRRESREEDGDSSPTCTA